MPYLRLLLLLLLPAAALAQELPPPGGWPLRPVSELRAVSEPPGGLVPYRQGALWGFADTTGRVWIKPVFDNEPTRFGPGLLLQAQKPPRKPKTKQLQRLPPRWNERYAHLYPRENGKSGLNLPNPKAPKDESAWLLNAQGEQLLARPDEAIVPAVDGRWQAVPRASLAREQGELVAIETREQEPEWQRPGQTFVATLGRQAKAGPPHRLTRQRAYELDGEFTASSAHNAPLYLARKVNWLVPHRMVTGIRDGIKLELEDTRYRHHGRFALFDARGHRLTDYRYAGMKPLLPQRLAYWHWTGDQYEDEDAADSSGMPRGYDLREDINGPARRYGLLDRRGREIIPPLYVRMEAVGPNSLWVVAVQEQRLHYGLIDTLGRYLLPLSPQPLSLPDATGLLRRRNSAPLKAVKSTKTFELELHYRDTATVQYVRPDGRPAFAGRFEHAEAFWQGRALVQHHGQDGLIDTLGNWVLPLQAEKLSYFAYTKAHIDNCKHTDPLALFDHFGHNHHWNSYPSTFPGAPLLLLTHGPQGYGLRDGHSGEILVPTVFDEYPTQWYGGVVGKRQGQPLGYSYTGWAFNPRLPASYPLGVWQPRPYAYVYRPLMQRTEYGWLTRGGRRLWQD